MIFRQLYEETSSTYTYVLGCEETGEAVLVDPVLAAWQRDLEVLASLGLTLRYTLETHIHADHVTAAQRLKREVGSRIAGPALDRLPCTDHPIEEGVPFRVGALSLTPLHTPGHTDNHFAYLIGERVLTGDALLIDGCGRTDFQNGDATALYRSITEKLFALPDDVLVYPAHDYQGRRVSTIAQERERNPRVGGGKTLEEFIRIMDALDLPYPKLIERAVPANRRCGAEPLERARPELGVSPQG